MADFEVLKELPVAGLRPKRPARYGAFFDAVVKANGDWVAIPVAEVGAKGNFPSSKTHSLRLAAAWRNLIVDLRRDETRCYVRLRVPVQAEVQG